MRAAEGMTPEETASLQVAIDTLLAAWGRMLTLHEHLRDEAMQRLRAELPPQSGVVFYCSDMARFPSIQVFWSNERLDPQSSDFRGDLLVFDTERIEPLGDEIERQVQVASDGAWKRWLGDPSKPEPPDTPMGLPALAWEALIDSTWRWLCVGYVAHGPQAPAVYEIGTEGTLRYAVPPEN